MWCILRRVSIARAGCLDRVSRQLGQQIVENPARASPSNRPARELLRRYVCGRDRGQAGASARSRACRSSAASSSAEGPSPDSPSQREDAASRVRLHTAPEECPTPVPEQFDSRARVDGLARCGGRRTPAVLPPLDRDRAAIAYGMELAVCADDGREDRPVHVQLAKRIHSRRCIGLTSKSEDQAARRCGSLRRVPVGKSRSRSRS
jgi:hypothetical protein